MSLKTTFNAYASQASLYDAPVFNTQAAEASYHNAKKDASSRIAINNLSVSETNIGLQPIVKMPISFIRAESHMRKKEVCRKGTSH